MSDSASVVLYLQQITSCQAASAAALLYDYLLALGSEVDLIWAREWNLVTLLYAIVRYLSFFLILDNIFYMGNVYWSSNMWASCFLNNSARLTDGGWPSGLVWYHIRMWGPYVFRVAMDIIMMKRISALSRSSSGFLNLHKWVLATMVTAFIAKCAASVTLLLLAIGPGSDLTSIEGDFSGTRVCGTMIPLATLLISSQFPTLGFEVLLFGLAFSYFVADAWGFWRSNEPEMRKVSDIVQILVRDSTIYFAINVAATALDVGDYKVSSRPSIYVAVSMALQSFLPYYFAPRLVINAKKYKNRVHTSRLGGDLSNIAPATEGFDCLPQGIRQVEDFA